MAKKIYHLYEADIVTTDKSTGEPTHKRSTIRFVSTCFEDVYFILLSRREKLAKENKELTLLAVVKAIPEVEVIPDLDGLRLSSPESGPDLASPGLTDSEPASGKPN